MAADSTQNSNVTPFRSGARPATKYSAPQRAAVVIAMLGEAAARPIVEKLDDAALSKVALALENISNMAKDELTDIVVDFLGHLRNSSTELVGGRQQAQEMITGVFEERRNALPDLGDFSLAGMVSEGDPSESSPAAADVWTRLAEKPPEKIAEYLGRLTPNLISLILRKLNVTLSSEVMGHLDEAKLEPIMGYLVEADTADAGIDAIVGRMVEMEFLNAVQESHTEEDQEHLQSVGEMLSLIPTSRRDSLMEFLKSRHEGKLEGIQKSLFTIDGLPDMLPRNTIPVIFREMEQPDILRLLGSLQGTYSAVADFLLSNISSRMADQLRDDLKEMPALDAEEAELVQRNFLTSLMTMKRRGTITMM